MDSLLQIMIPQIERLKQRYVSLLGMLLASMFLSKWFEPNFLTYADRTWMHFENKEYLQALPVMTYLLVVLTAAWGTIGCIGFYLIGFVGRISGTNLHSAEQVALDHWNRGYFIAVTGYLFLAFFEVKEFMIQCEKLLIEHRWTILTPATLSFSLLFFAILWNVMPSKETERQTLRFIVVMIFFFILLQGLITFADQLIGWSSRWGNTLGP